MQKKKKKKKKIEKKICLFQINDLNWELQILSILNMILATGSQCVTKPQQDFAYNWGSHFANQFT